MPTPFMHLQFAEEIQVETGSRHGGNGRLRRWLAQAWPAFYLGSVAPDYQTICDIPRARTHFYELPPGPDDRAFPDMLARYPELADAAALPPVQALFVAAYGVHLRLDLLWFRQILVPYFVELPGLGDFPRRHLTHNIVLAHLDKLAFESLPQTAAATLAAARPQAWLPFADDAHLVRWRDMLVAQLQSDSPFRTVEIYADRLQMSAEAFAANLQDAVWMEEQVFNKIPMADIQAKLEAAVPQSVALITDYLQIEE